MSGGLVAIVIVAIVSSMIVRLVQIQHGTDRTSKRRSERGGAEPGHLPSPREAELQRELEDLRERVKVLERITTDAHTADALQSRSIAAEIESLRDR